MKYVTRVNDREYEIEIDREGEVVVDGERYTVDFLQMADTDTVSLLINSRSIAALVDARNEHWEVLIRGELYNVEVLDERAYRLSQARADLRSEGEKAVTAPMPGVVLGVLVEEGQHVESGDKVVILESMKMENELRANRSGVVTHVHVAAGDSVEKNQSLVSIGDEG